MTEILLVLVLVAVLVSWMGDFAWWAKTTVRWLRKARWYLARFSLWAR